MPEWANNEGNPMSQIPGGNIERAIALSDTAGRLAVNFNCVDSPQAKKLCARLLDMANDLLAPPVTKEAQPDVPVITCQQLAHAITIANYTSHESPGAIAEAIFRAVHATPPSGR